MTIVTMKVAVSGSRDGTDWPPVGGQIDLPEDEALGLVENGLATFAPGSPTHEPPAGDSAAAIDTITGSEQATAPDAGAKDERTVAQLQEALKDRGLPFTGKRDELIARLVEADAAAAPAAPDAATDAATDENTPPTPEDATADAASPTD